MYWNEEMGRMVDMVVKAGGDAIPSMRITGRVGLFGLEWEYGLADVTDALDDGQYRSAGLCGS